MHALAQIRINDGDLDAAEEVLEQLQHAALARGDDSTWARLQCDLGEVRALQVKARPALHPVIARMIRAFCPAMR